MRGKQTPNAYDAIQEKLTRLAKQQTVLHVAEGALFPYGTKREAWEYEGWRERRRFTAMVEALLTIDRRGSANDWSIAWTAVNGLRLLLHRLANWDNPDWKRIHDEGIDHWKDITHDGETETEDALWSRRPMHEEGTR